MKISTMLRLNPDPSVYDGLMHRIVESAHRIEAAGAFVENGTIVVRPLVVVTTIACRSLYISGSTAKGPRMIPGGAIERGSGPNSTITICPGASLIVRGIGITHSSMAPSERQLRARHDGRR